MNTKGLAFKVLGMEALIIALLGTGIFFYVQSAKKSADKARLAATSPESRTNNPPPEPVKVKPEEAKAFSDNYEKEGKSVPALAGAVQFRPEVDLIVFVIDTSASMNDDRQDLRDSIKKITDRYKQRAFDVVNYADTAEIAGEPTRKLSELQKYIDEGRNLGGQENSYLALTTAASKAREKFKAPAIVLMTDAAPNDGGPGSASQVTLEQAAETLNAANAELHVWAAFDFQEEMSGGSAARSDAYPTLSGRVKAGGKVYLVKRNTFDPNWFLQLFK